MVVGPSRHPQGHPACDHFVRAQGVLWRSNLVWLLEQTSWQTYLPYRESYPSQPAYRRSLVYSCRFLPHPGPSSISQSELQPIVSYLNLPEPPLWRTSKSRDSVRLRKRKLFLLVIDLEPDSITEQLADLGRLTTFSTLACPRLWTDRNLRRFIAHQPFQLESRKLSFPWYRYHRTYLPAEER